MTTDERSRRRASSLARLAQRDWAALGAVAADLVAATADERAEALDQAGASAEELAAARKAVERQFALLSRGQGIARNMLSVLDRLDERRKYREKYDEEHWPLRLKALSTTSAEDHDRGLEQWLGRYVDALASWELEECRRLGDAGGELFDDETAAEAQRAAAALIDGDYAGAHQFVGYLAGGAPVDNTPLVDQRAMSVMEVLLGRMQLGRLSDVDEGDRQRLDQEAESHFSRAADLNPDAAAPIAGLAALERRRGYLADALETAEEAIDTQPDAPDGHIEAALCAEAAGNLPDAADAFDRAAEILAGSPAPLQATETVLRSHSPMLWLRLAEHLHAGARQREALEAVGRAIDGRVSGIGNAAAESYELKVEILRSLDGSPAEISDALQRAGKERLWATELDQAQMLFERAIELTPDEPVPYLFLADVHLSLCYLPDDRIDPDQLERAKQRWYEGDARAKWDEHPLDAWAFLTRALLAQQEARLRPEDQSSLWWQAVVCLDRAIHYRPEMAQAWGHLGGYLRDMGFFWGALDAIEKAFQLREPDPTVLEQRIITLVDRGDDDDYDTALELVATRAAQRPTDDEWHRCVEAEISLRSGHLDEAAHRFDAGLADDSTYIGFLTRRAECGLLRGETDAVDRLRAILSAADEDPENIDPAYLRDFTIAATYLGETNRAQALLDYGTGVGILDPFARAFHAGAIEAVRGNVAEAVALMGEAIEAAVNPGDLQEMRVLFVPSLRAVTAERPHSGELAAAFVEMEEQTLPARRHELLQRKVGYPLLRKEFARAEREWAGADEVAAADAEARRVGAGVVLARLFRLGGQPGEAARWYRLVAESDQYPEAEAALNDVHAEMAKQMFERFPLPLVTPLAVEVSEYLSGLALGDGDSLAPGFQAQITAMRARVLESFGVRLPGLRMRTDEALPPGGYVLMLNEVPLASFTMELGRRLARAPAATLLELGVVGQRTTDPLDGSDAVWVDEDQWGEVAAAEIPLLDLMEYPLRHLESLVVANLALFVGHQELSNLAWQESPELGRRLDADTSALGDFARVVRSLLEEKVPISPLGALAEAFLSLRESGAAVWDIEEELRMLPGLRMRLPGNDDGRATYHLSDRIEGLFADAIRGTDDGPMLAMGPQDVADVLTSVREVVEDHPRERIVVQNPRVRRVVRELIQLEFPQLPVLAGRELQGAPVEPQPDIVIRL